MIIIEYDPQSGNCIPDGQVNSRAELIVQVARVGGDAHFIYSSATMIRKVLSLVKHGKIPHDKVKVRYDTFDCLVSKDGKIINAPNDLARWIEGTK